jgi:hypothetical protein
VDRREIAQDLDHVLGDAHFLFSLAQRGVDRVAVVGVRTAARKCDMSSVGWHRFWSFDQHHPQLGVFVFEERNQDRRGGIAVIVRELGKDSKAVRHRATL